MSDFEREMLRFEAKQLREAADAHRKRGVETWDAELTGYVIGVANYLEVMAEAQSESELVPERWDGMS